MNKVILSLTPTGMVPTKAMTYAVPIWPGEIVADVLGCVKLGITMVHLHARDEEGRPTWRKEVYAEIIRGIRKAAPDLVICVSLSGRDVGEFEKRADVLALQDDLKPDMGSLTLSSLNFQSQASVNSPDTIKRLAADMLKRGIVPELEIFDLGMANYANYLVEKGLVHENCYANVFLGNIAGAQLDLIHAGALISSLPKKAVWSLAGIGDAQLPANLIGIAMGGGVRVGLEDSIWLDSKRTELATNALLVSRIHSAAGLMGKGIMTSLEFRALMGMKPGRGDYGR
jgi:uncharacterized protein (DUF849 family)